MATFATNVQLQALQAGFSDRSAEQMNQSRYAAYAIIVSALDEGGYAISTIAASPTVYGFLTLLEVRMAALDLLGGGAASSAGLASAATWEHWAAQVKEWLQLLRDGQMALVIDGTGAITDPPNSANNAGILSDSRNPGVNLDAPELWSETDNLEEY